MERSGGGGRGRSMSVAGSNCVKRSGKGGQCGGVSSSGSNCMHLELFL